MTAASSAAQATTASLPREWDGAVVAILAIIVLGGLIEGLALGVLQARVLARWLPEFSLARWVTSTLLVASLGWAAASAPATLAGDADGSTPSLWLIALGALGLGVAMGAVLGLAQAGGFVGRVVHPWRWVAVSMAAWAPAMVVIFIGATLPDASWPAYVVIPLGTVTGLLAGTILGLVSGVLMPWLSGTSAVNALVLDVLQSRAHRILDRSLAALRVTGSVTGRQFTLPVQYARHGSSVVVVPARPETKRWWHNLEEPAVVDLLIDGHWEHGLGRVLTVADLGYDEALRAYIARWPRVDVAAGPVVVLTR